MPEASFSHSATVLASRRDVWKRLQAATTWSEIGPVESVWDPRHDDHGQLAGYRWSTSVGPRRYEGTAERIDGHAPDHIALALDAGEISGVLAATLEALSEHETKITVELTIQPRGVLSTMFFGVISDVVTRGLPRQVEQFAESCR